jgi:hypothetical protein
MVLHTLLKTSTIQKLYSKCSDCFFIKKEQNCSGKKAQKMTALGKKRRVKESVPLLAKGG